jgi:hypothetical protein
MVYFDVQSVFSGGVSLNLLEELLFLRICFDNCSRYFSLNLRRSTLLGRIGVILFVIYEIKANN